MSVPPRQSNHRSRKPARPVGLLLSSALVLGGLAALPAAAQEDDLVVNGSFSNGADGWRTNGPDQSVDVVDGVARLTTARQDTGVLNDLDNTVESAEAGTDYRVQARVRTTTPGVSGALRIREVTEGEAITHQTRFNLNDDAWQTVDLTLQTSQQGASLDLNILAWDLPAGQELWVDDVSLQAEGARPGPVPSPPPGDPVPPPSDDCEGTVPEGTQFGTSVSTLPRGSTFEGVLRDLDDRFGQLPVIRRFATGLPREWAGQEEELTRGRTVVTSFRPSPQSVLTGQHDEYLRQWFENAPDDRYIYWSYIHEPESEIDDGDFTMEHYVDAWEHIAGIADSACKPHMFSTLILSGWTARPESGRDWTEFDAGSEYVDMLSWDPYNQGAEDGRTRYDSAESIYGQIVEIHAQDGRPFGIAETGSRLVPGDNGSRRATWLNEMANYLEDSGATYVTYFESTKGGDFRLTDEPSRRAWAAIVD